MTSYEHVINIISSHYPNCKIIKYSEKHSKDGATSSVKLCIVIAHDNLKALESEIYKLVDSDICFDIVCYESTVFEKLVSDTSSFAYNIQATGTVLYG